MQSRLLFDWTEYRFLALLWSGGWESIFSPLNSKVNLKSLSTQSLRHSFSLGLPLTRRYFGVNRSLLARIRRSSHAKNPKKPTRANSPAFVLPGPSNSFGDSTV
mmetsp:Transcript_18280/g.50404  ORF Transcript_18280/g.50404 Transcript_18280/m.50404 type:complete len:104 (-) Transcript_18280:184-495(-)